MFDAEVKEFPFVEQLPKSEKGRVRKAWDALVELRAAYKEHGLLVPVRLVPQMLNVSRQRVDQIINAGHLKEVRPAGTRFITEASLKAFADLDRGCGYRYADPDVSDLKKLVKIIISGPSK